MDAAVFAVGLAVLGLAWLLGARSSARRGGIRVACYAVAGGYELYVEAAGGARTVRILDAPEFLDVTTRSGCRISRDAIRVGWSELPRTYQQLTWQMVDHWQEQRQRRGGGA